MLSVLESQILTKYALQFTRNMTRFTRSLSDQMNSMIKTNHLSKIHFAEMPIIITRNEFTFEYSSVLKINGHKFFDRPFSLELNSGKGLHEKFR